MEEKELKKNEAEEAGGNLDVTELEDDDLEEAAGGAGNNCNCGCGLL